MPEIVRFSMFNRKVDYDTHKAWNKDTERYAVVEPGTYIANILYASKHKSHHSLYYAVLNGTKRIGERTVPYSSDYLSVSIELKDLKAGDYISFPEHMEIVSLEIHRSTENKRIMEKQVEQDFKIDAEYTISKPGSYTVNGQEVELKSGEMKIKYNKTVTKEEFEQMTGIKVK